MTDRISALIVDDEPAARRRITRLLESHADFAVAGEAGDGATALEAVATLKPAVVFLDVEMPVLDGLSTARSLGEGRTPLIVFVTAHERFAATAFQQDAVDYLLKPFDEDRFAVAIARIRRRLHQSAAPAPPPCDRLLALVRGTARLLRVSDIGSVTAAGNYAEVAMTDGSRYLVRETISALAASLPPSFAQISRSTIIRLDQVESVVSSGHGDATVTLFNGTRLRLSRRYRAGLADWTTTILSRSSRS